MAGGYLVLSLDLELFWGVRDVQTLERYGANVRGVHEALPQLLDVLDRHRVRATFAVVGLLLARTKGELLANVPRLQPTYTDRRLSPYLGHLALVGEDLGHDPYHFGEHLVQLARERGQEIGSHTFSHYYCLESGQTLEQFEADLVAFEAMARSRGLEVQSLVFPRNQFNQDYLAAIARHGFRCYRGNERSWIYQARAFKRETLLQRGLRLLDSYVSLTGPNTYALATLAQTGLPFEIPASRFLRPYSPRLRWLEPFRLARICQAMTNAARAGELFHLWWHPHNMGLHIAENLAFLERVLRHFDSLQGEGFQSATMGEIAGLLAQGVR